MFQHRVSLSHRWLAMFASCILSLVMLTSVMPPSARSRAAAGGINIAPPASSQSVDAGKSVTHAFSVTNNTGADGVFTVTVSGNLWTTQVNVNGVITSQLVLAASNSATVDVIVTATVLPGGTVALPNARDVATLTVVAHSSNPSIAAEAVLATTVNLVKVYLPIVLHNWPPWTQGSGDIAARTVHQIAVCPADSNRLYAGTITTGVYASTNAGVSWSPTGLSGVLVRGVEVNPTNCSEAYAFAWGSGVMKTTNGGITWTPKNSNLNELLYGYSVVIDPTQPQTVYAGTNVSGVYRSTDGGAHWSHTAIPNTPVLGLSIGPDGTVYAATYGKGVYRLKNGVATPLNGGALSSTANVFAVAASSSTLFAATDIGVYRLVAGETAWTSVLSDKGRVFSVLIDPQNAQIVYAGLEAGGVWRSVDGGLTFNSYSQGMPAAGVGVRNVAIGSATSSYLHAGTVLNGAWRIPYP